MLRILIKWLEKAIPNKNVSLALPIEWEGINVNELKSYSPYEHTSCDNLYRTSWNLIYRFIEQQDLLSYRIFNYEM